MHAAYHAGPRPPQEFPNQTAVDARPPDPAPIVTSARLAELEQTAREALAPDPSAAIAFLKLLHPDGPWVLTAITPDGPATTETFSKLDTTAAWIERQNARRNLYWMPAEATGLLRKKATKADIAGTFLLWVDLDGTSDPGRLNGHAPPPTTIVASGGGLNLYWALAEPIRDTDEIEARNRWLGQQLGADACWNCDRILRLPGTINWPNKKKRSNGRVPVLARCTEHHPDRIGDFDDFGRIESSEGRKEGERVDLGDDIPLLTLDDIPDVRDKLDTWAQRLIREGPQPDEYRGDRSKAVWAVTCALVRVGASDAQIAGILLNPALPIHDHVRDQKGHGPRAYVARQIERARELVEIPEDQGEAEKPKRRLQFANFADMSFTGALLNLIKGIMGEAQTWILFGDSGTGKSLIALAIAMHIGLGRLFCGRKVKQGFVAYLSPEGATSIALRAHAWAKHHGVDLRSIPVRGLPYSIDLCHDDTDLNEIIAGIRELEAELGHCVLIVIDTVSRALSGGDENKPSDMGAFVVRCDKLREAFGATIMPVHHIAIGGEEPRGHRSLRNAGDVRAFVTKLADGLCQLEIKHAKDGENGEKILFRVVTEEVASDDSGEPIRGALVVHETAKPAESGRPDDGRYTDRQIRVLQELRKQAAIRRSWDFTFREFADICLSAGVLADSANDNTRRGIARDLRTQLANKRAITVDGKAETVRLL